MQPFVMKKYKKMPKGFNMWSQEKLIVYDHRTTTKEGYQCEEFLCAHMAKDKEPSIPEWHFVSDLKDEGWVFYAGK